MAEQELGGRIEMEMGEGREIEGEREMEGWKEGGREMINRIVISW